MNFQRGFLVIALAAMLGQASVSHATLIAYEGFDYPAGTVVGANGGTGWSAAWAGARTDVVAGGRTYTDSLGNQLVVSGNSAVATGQAGNGDSNRAMATTINSGTTWWSFIGQRLSPQPTPGENVARGSSLQLREGTTEKLAVGKGTTALTPDPPGPTFNWSMLHSGAVANAVQTNDPILQQAFLLIRIDHLGDSTVADNVYLWVNPNLDSEPAIGTAEVQQIGLRDYSFNQVRFFAGNTSSPNPYANFAGDEIRLGTTFADVTPFTPVPEPATLVLAGVGAVGLGLAARRRKAA